MAPNVFAGAGLYDAFERRSDYLRQRDIADAERLRDHAIQNAQLSMQKTAFDTSQQEASQAYQQRAQQMQEEAAQNKRAAQLFPGQLKAQQEEATQRGQAIALTQAQIRQVKDQASREGMNDLVFGLSSTLNSHYAGKTPQQIANLTREERLKLDELTPAETKSLIDSYNAQGNVRIDPKTFHFDPATHQISFVYGSADNPADRKFQTNTLEGLQRNMYLMAHMGDKPTDVAPGHTLWTPLGGTVASNDGRGGDGSGLGSVFLNPEKYNGVEWSNSAAGVVADALGGKFADGQWNIGPQNQEKWKLANNMIGQMEQKYGPNLDPRAAGSMVLDALNKGYQSDSDVDAKVKAEASLVYSPHWYTRVADFMTGNGGQNPVVNGIDTSKVSEDDYIKQRTDQLNNGSQQNLQEALSNNVLGYFKAQNGASPQEIQNNKPTGGNPVMSQPQPTQDGGYPTTTMPQPGAQPGLQDVQPGSP